MYTNLTIEYSEQTALVQINRPKQLNALNRETLGEIQDAFKTTLSTDKDIRGVILTGVGEKAFVAGADIKEFMHYTAEEGAELARWGHGVMNTLYHFPKPVIAAINGFALGGGLELALACHLRIAASTARLGLPEVSLGLIPGYGGTQRLTQLVGRGKALEMILSGDMVDAEDAFRWGLVNAVVPADALLDKAKTILTKTYSKSGHAIAAAISAVNKGLEYPAEGFEAEQQAFGDCFGTPDFKEGTEAFLGKRKPNF